MQRADEPRYLADIATARKTHPDLEVYAGLEVDYIPRVIGPAGFQASLDFTIGSIHFVGRFDNTWWEIDNTVEVFSEGLERIFQNDVRAAVSEYFNLTRGMIRESRPDILGHLDKIKINAKKFSLDESEPWYVSEVEETLRTVRGTKTIIEVNTRGIYKKKSDTTYPSPWILERILHEDIPVTISSDAHHPEELTREFQSTHELMKQIGFKYISVLKNGIWKSVPLNEYGAAS
jgi:histidinol-phosphatase (PHP family)